MNYLLDTHVFLWALFDSDKISRPSKRILENGSNTIFVSIITFWEISLKYAAGKLELTNILPDQLPGAAEASGFSVLNISTDEAAGYYKLPTLRHKDPFDRLIVLQAVNNKIPLITKDKTLADYEQFGLRTIW